MSRATVPEWAEAILDLTMDDLAEMQERADCEGWEADDE